MRSKDALALIGHTVYWGNVHRPVELVRVAQDGTAVVDFEPVEDKPFDGLHRVFLKELHVTADGSDPKTGEPYVWRTVHRPVKVNDPFDG